MPFEKLKTAVEINGIAYPIYTDFRHWIKFEKLTTDEDVSDLHKQQIMLDWFKETVPPQLDEAVQSLLLFYLNEEEIPKASNNASSVVALDYVKDFPLIHAGFYQTYGISLYSDNLHWHEFLALLEALPDDTQIKKIMGYRVTDTSKMKGEQKKHYEKLKEHYSLETRKQQSLANRAMQMRKEQEEGE